MRNRIIAIAIAAIILLYITGVLSLNTNRLFNPGSLVMVLGAIFVFFSSSIAPVIGLEGEKGNVIVKSIGLGLLVVAVIILVTTNG